MTDNLKKFLEAASQDKAFIEKLKKAETPEAVIALAAEKGFTLTMEDLKPALQTGEVSDDEMDAVAGGKECYCAIGGGGVAGGNDTVCACVLMGEGDGYWKTITGEIIIKQRCICPFAGQGDSHNNIGSGEDWSKLYNK